MKLLITLFKGSYPQVKKFESKKELISYFRKLGFTHVEHTEYHENMTEEAVEIFERDGIVVESCGIWEAIDQAPCEYMSLKEQYFDDVYGAILLPESEIFRFINRKSRLIAYTKDQNDVVVEAVKNFMENR